PSSISSSAPSSSSSLPAASCGLVPSHEEMLLVHVRYPFAIVRQAWSCQFSG
ncbi:hypothetical protein CCACVL1_03137, partial [Corchorus capsularis]